MENDFFTKSENNNMEEKQLETQNNFSENKENKKRLYKSTKKMLCGVCGGIAEYFNIDPAIIRLLVVFLSLAGVGCGLLAYIIAAIIMPEKDVA